MSMILTPTKSRVTHSRGYRLTPEDGTAPTHDERRGIRRTYANDSAYVENPSVNDYAAKDGGYPFANNESLHVELCKRDNVQIAAVLKTWGFKGDAADVTRYRDMVAEHFAIEASRDRLAAKGQVHGAWILTADFEGYRTTPVKSRKTKSQRVKSAPRKSGPTPKSVRKVDSEIDRMIRATGYTGTIDKRMRAAARDVVAHKISVAAYCAG